MHHGLRNLAKGRTMCFYNVQCVIRITPKHVYVIESSFKLFTKPMTKNTNIYRLQGRNDSSV